jgi:signal-transduction protein with cAMP-binding, CBS, and nucleotidyltransferase domain
MRLGYEPVKAEELPGFEHLKVKAGEHTGFVACNEMLLYKLPMDIYQELMYELHHLAPMEEQEKIKVQQEQLLGERDSNGKTLVSIEGGGVGFDAKVKPRPVFE